MADQNGHDHESRIARLEAARKELEDSFVVMTHLETKAAARVKEHAEFIAGHQQAIREMDEKLKDHAEFIVGHQQAIREMDEKLNALIDIVGKMQGGLESRPS
jgi:hypothetical protein